MLNLRRRFRNGRVERCPKPSTRLLAAAEELDESTAAMVTVMGLCGLRIGEAIALRWADVNFDSGTMSLSGSMSRREGVRPLKARESPEESRIARMGLDVEDRLRLHLVRYPGEPADFVFRSPEGYPISYTNW